MAPARRRSSHLKLPAFAAESAEDNHLETIPVVAAEFDSLEYFNAVQQVIDSVNFLTGGGSPHALSFDEMPADAVTVYYVDFILQRLLKDGSRGFAENQLPLHPLTIRDIERGLRQVGAERHLQLLRSFLTDASEGTVDFDAYDHLFQDMQSSENLLLLNERVLRKSPAFVRMTEAEANAVIAAALASELQACRKKENP
jgi:hypothetical protein